jgi:phage recombination protein Bet
MSITVNTNTGELAKDDIDSKKDLLKRTIFKGASDDELELFFMVCKRTGLDPFMKQIYPVPRWDKNANRNVMTMQTSIDGFRLIAERTGRYCPGREPMHNYDENKRIVSATAYVKKLTSDGTWHEVAATAYYQEYVQKGKEGNPSKFWAQMPHLMIAKCAEALALRRAFPAELSGIYTKDEMNQAENEHSTATLIEVEKVLEVPTIENNALPDEKVAQIDMLIQELGDTAFVDKLNSYCQTAYNVSNIYYLNDVQFDKVVTRLEKEITKRKEGTYESRKMA